MEDKQQQKKKKAPRREASFLRLYRIIETFPLTILFLSLFAVLAIRTAYHYAHVSYYAMFGTFTSHEKAICNSAKIMLAVQREQLKRAQDEVFGVKKPHPHATHRHQDLGMYEHSYGSVNINTQDDFGGTKSATGFAAVVYYRLWKCANDHISGTLSRFAMLNAYEYKKEMVCHDTPNNCIGWGGNDRDLLSRTVSNVHHVGMEAMRSVFFPAALYSQHFAHSWLHWHSHRRRWHESHHVCRR